MKKIILLAIMAVVIVGCYNYDYQERKNTGNSPYHVFVDEVRGHEYVVVTIKQGYGCGVSVVHSESCKCKQLKQKQ